MIASKQGPAGSRLLGLGHYRPANVVTNDEAVQTFELPLVPLDEQLRRVA